MKRNKRKTFAYRPSDKIISRESIVSVILGAAGIIGCTCNGIVLAVSVIIFVIGIIAMI